MTSFWMAVAFACSMDGAQMSCGAFVEQEQMFPDKAKCEAYLEQAANKINPDLTVVMGCAEMHKPSLPKKPSVKS